MSECVCVFLSVCVCVVHVCSFLLVFVWLFTHNRKGWVLPLSLVHSLEMTVVTIEDL